MLQCSIVRLVVMERPIRNNLIVELHVPDFAQVKDFYIPIGFTVIDEDPIGEELGYLVLKRDDPVGSTMLNFYGGDERVYKQPFFGKYPSDTVRGYAVEITIPIGDIDAYYSQIFPVIRRFIVQELVRKSWGQKEFRLRDPFGFYVRFTEIVDWGQS
jgi:hypothetical protein